MTVAPLELCKELYELTEWTDVSNTWMKYSLNDQAEVYAIAPSQTGISVLSGEFEYKYPAYDLEWLLIELPKWSMKDMSAIGKPRYRIRHASYVAFGETPVEAACRLMIELIRKEVIK